MVYVPFVKVCICYNPLKPEAKSLAERVCMLLHEKGVDAYSMADPPPEDAKISIDSPDLLITCGGDGTVLRVMRWFSGPVLAINAGGMGFLTEGSGDDVEELLERVYRGDYSIDSRMKIMTLKNGVRFPDAVNEVILHTDQVGKIRKFRVSIRNEKISMIRADGVMVATPTGSTSYALSAGGPIIHPSLDAMTIVFMSPFTLTAKPMVVPGDSMIELTCDDGGCILVIDGQDGLHVPPGEVVQISRSEIRAQFIRFRPHFFSRLNKRLTQE